GAPYGLGRAPTLPRPPAEGISAGAAPPPPRGGFFLQGLVVLLSNPKLLIFFGAFLPQFMDMGRDHVSQATLLGVTFMVIAAVTDGIYALLAGRARKFSSSRRARLVSRISGGFMIGGGVWLALTRALNQPLRGQRQLVLAEDARQPLRPLLLVGLIGDQVLPDLDAGVDQAARLAMHGNRVVGLVADRIGLVVADHEIGFRAQRLQQARR